MGALARFSLGRRALVALVTVFIVLVALIGAAIGVLVGNGILFTVIALVISGLIAFTSYWKADKVALAVSRARPAPQPDRGGALGSARGWSW